MKNFENKTESPKSHKTNLTIKNKTKHFKKTCETSISILFSNLLSKMRKNVFGYNFEENFIAKKTLGCAFAIPERYFRVKSAFRYV